LHVARHAWSGVRIADALERRPGYESLRELVEYATNRLGAESLEDPAFTTYADRTDNADVGLAGAARAGGRHT
jgi:hypothetical protein